MTDFAVGTEQKHLSWRAWWEGVMALPWWSQCVILWLILALALSAVGLASVRVLDLREGYDPVIGVSPYSIPGIWARWDSPYYVDLASQGYEALPYAMGYFPLYPLLMAGFSRITGENLTFAGMLIAQISYLGAILLFYKLARLVRDEHEYAMRSVVFMVLFPSAFFFFAVYAEPLALALSILGVYLALRPRAQYISSGLTLGIGAAARPVGWLLDTVLIVDFIRRGKFKVRSLISLAAGLALSISGIVAFVLYLYTLTGRLTAIPEAAAEWGRQWQYPWITVWKSVRNAITGNAVAGDWFLYLINWSDLLFTVLALVLTAVAVWWSFKKKFLWSLSSYLVAALIFLLSNQGLESVPLWGMTRWVAPLFPMYLILAELTREKRALWWGVIAVLVLLQLVFFAWWSSGRWIG